MIIESRLPVWPFFCFLFQTCRKKACTSQKLDKESGSFWERLHHCPNQWTVSQGKKITKNICMFIFFKRITFSFILQAMKGKQSKRIFKIFVNLLHNLLVHDYVSFVVVVLCLPNSTLQQSEWSRNGGYKRTTIIYYLLYFVYPTPPYNIVYGVGM